MRTIEAREPTDRGISLVVMGSGATFARPLPATGEVSLGRDDECDITLDDPKVSRCHLVVRVEAEGLAVVDRGSRNGSWLGSRKLEPDEPVRITVGDVLRLGSTVVLVQAGTSGKASPDLPVASNPMAELEALVDRVAAGHINVLLLGETGAGKEVMARTIHRKSPRSGAPLVCLNCAAFSETLLESELFGHEKGAFTGAVRDKPGLLESAAGGVVFLDETGEMPLSLQAKLLRVLEQREVLRVGSLRPRPIDVRFIAATNRDLEAEIRAGRFRQDLYFRLNGVTLTIPPLRARPQEIASLATRFAADAARDRPSPPAFSADTLAALRSYPWPGNIRELKNVIDRAVLLCNSEVLEPEHLQLPRVAPPSAPGVESRDDAAAAGESEADDAERERVLAAMQECGNNQTHAAKLLGMSRGTLIARLTKYNVRRPHKR